MVLRKDESFREDEQNHHQGNLNFICGRLLKVGQLLLAKLKFMFSPCVSGTAACFSTALDNCKSTPCLFCVTYQLPLCIQPLNFLFIMVKTKDLIPSDLRCFQ